MSDRRRTPGRRAALAAILALPLLAAPTSIVLPTTHVPTPEPSPTASPTPRPVTTPKPKPKPPLPPTPHPTPTSHLKHPSPLPSGERGGATGVRGTPRPASPRPTLAPTLRPTPRPTPTATPFTPTPQPAAPADLVAFGAAVGAVATLGQLAPAAALAVAAEPLALPGWRPGLVASFLAHDFTSPAPVRPSWAIDAACLRTWRAGPLSAAVGPGYFLWAPIAPPPGSATTGPAGPFRHGPEAVLALGLRGQPPWFEGALLGLEATAGATPWSFPAGAGRWRADAALAIDVAGARARVGWRTWAFLGADALDAGGPYLGLDFADPTP